MALNSNGAISLGGSTQGQSINLELGNGATSAVSLNDTAVRGLAGVSSGSIIMPTNFYGKSSFSTVVNITNQNITSFAEAYYDQFAIAEAGYELSSTGSAIGFASYQSTGYSSGTGTYSGQWFVSGTKTAVSARATQISSNGNGSITGPLDTWTPLGTNSVTWTLVTGVGGGAFLEGNITLRIQIAQTSNLSNILDTADIYLEASAQSYTNG